MCLAPDGGGSGGMPSGLRPKTILGDGGSAPANPPLPPLPQPPVPAPRPLSAPRRMSFIPPTKLPAAPITPGGPLRPSV